MPHEWKVQTHDQIHTVGTSRCSPNENTIPEKYLDYSKWIGS